MALDLGLVTIVVADYDEAIAFYTNKLGFMLVKDEARDEGKRWVVVRPGEGAGILLAQAKNDEERARIGNQTGGRVGFFLYASDFQSTYESMRAEGVEFLEEPRYEAYGAVAKFMDLYGNKWDLLEN